jgi:hypothetical protein
MADLITLQEAQAWGEKTKLAPAWKDGLDHALLEQLQVEVLGNIGTVADTSTWIDSNSTPGLAKTIIAKLYVAWLIDRQYSEDADLSAYAALLRTTAMSLMTAITSSVIDIPGVIINSDGLPSVYPTDTDPAEGPYFRMDAIF